MVKRRPLELAASSRLRRTPGPMAQIRGTDHARSVRCRRRRVEVTPASPRPEARATQRLLGRSHISDVRVAAELVNALTP